MYRGGEQIIATFEDDAPLPLPKNFGAPEVMPPRNLQALTKRQQRIYTELVLSFNIRCCFWIPERRAVFGYPIPSRIKTDET